MELTYTNSFVDITDSYELFDVNGGSLTLGGVVLIVCGCVVVCAAVGFIGGCIYEGVFGK